MVPIKQNLWDVQPFEALRPCKMRILKHACLEAFLGCACIGTHDAGQQANAGIDEEHCWKLAAGQDKVAYADLLQRACREDPLVKPLKSATQDKNARPASQLPHARLR